MVSGKKIYHWRILIALVTVLLLASVALNYYFFVEARRRGATIAYLQSLNAGLVDEIEELRPLKKTRDEENERLAVVEEMCRIRELPLKHPISFSKMSREELKSYIEEELDDQYPGRKMEYLIRSLIRLGFIDKEFDLRQKVIDLYTEQVGGLYDNDNDSLYLIEGAPATGSMDRTFLAHEVVHVLQDQDLGLDNLPLELMGNDDRVMASIALVEGDATVAMFKFYISHADMGVLSDLAAAVFTDSKEYSDAPDFLKENLLFPYVRGSAFVSSLFMKGGWERVDAAYKEPPSSTEQIMHPGKYGGKRDDPVAVSLPDLGVFGWEKLEENVLGEFNSYVLLKSHIGAHDAEEAAAGWGGDTYGLFVGEGGEVLVWLSVWDGEGEAEEVYGALGAFMEEARGLKAEDKRGEERDLGWSTEKDIYYLGRRGKEVLFISGSLGTDVLTIRNAFERFREEEAHEEMLSG